MVRRLPLLITLISVGMLFKAVPSHAQVSVAPTALFLTDQDRFGAIHVTNQSGNPQEVTIGFRFGYTKADSVGSVYLQYEDTTMAEKYSIASYVRAFPQRFILPPGETQVVRLTARPPANTGSNWMWTRVLTTSTPQVEFPDTTSAGVQANIIFRLQQVTALFYSKGQQNTAVSLGEIDARVDSNEVVVQANFEKSGDGPFLGTAVLKVKDSSGREVGEHRSPVAIYVSERRRFAVSLPDDVASTSNLQVELAINSERTDIPAEYVVKFTPVAKIAAVAP